MLEMFSEEAQMTERETKADHRATAERIYKELCYAGFCMSTWHSPGDFDRIAEESKRYLTKTLESLAVRERKLGMIEGMRKARVLCEEGSRVRDLVGNVTMRIAYEADQLEKELEDEER